MKEKGFKTKKNFWKQYPDVFESLIEANLINFDREIVVAGEKSVPIQKQRKRAYNIELDESQEASSQPLTRVLVHLVISKGIALENCCYRKQ